MKLLKLFISLFFICQLQAQKSDFIHLDFTKADSVAMAYKNNDIKNLPKLAYNLTNNLETNAEKFRAIYFWVATNIANDYDLQDLHDAKLNRFKSNSIKLNKWIKTFKPKLFKNLLKHNKTICTGYAYIIKELCYFANLKCKIIHGFGRSSLTDVENFNTPNHSWNAVFLNNKWYLVDVTWASGTQDLITMDFRFNYSDGYFFTEPKLFAKTHYPLDKKWLLLGNETYTFNFFLNEAIIYRNGYEKLNQLISPKQMHSYLSTKDDAIFKFTLNKNTTKADFYLVVDNGYQSERTQVKPILIENNKITLKHKFKTPGFYDVHLFIKNDLVATYTFKVR
ncbi:transglutaminase domain-containing protein [Aurantibacter sp.]|uniref:transglutaminase domain-containing protein n=1 Tax=Aurantibacter sp. TaxID=2807103 RepID=UPI0035C7EFC8